MSSNLTSGFHGGVSEKSNVPDLNPGKVQAFIGVNPIASAKILIFISLLASAGRLKLFQKVIDFHSATWYSKGESKEE